MTRHQNSFWTLPQPQKIAKRQKNYPKIRSQLKDRNEGTIENKSCSTIKVVPINKFGLNLTPNTYNLGPQKNKSDPEIMSKSIVIIEGSIEYESYSAILLDQKMDLEIDSKLTHWDPKKSK